jgi:hypothetical protein
MSKKEPKGITENARPILYTSISNWKAQRTKCSSANKKSHLRKMLRGKKAKSAFVDADKMQKNRFNEHERQAGKE